MFRAQSLAWMLSVSTACPPGRVSRGHFGFLLSWACFPPKHSAQMPALCPAAARRDPSAHLPPSVWGQLPKCPPPPSALLQAQSPPAALVPTHNCPPAGSERAGHKAFIICETKQQVPQEGRNKRPMLAVMTIACHHLKPDKGAAQRQGVGTALAQAAEACSLQDQECVVKAPENWRYYFSFKEKDLRRKYISERYKCS